MMTVNATLQPSVLRDTAPVTDQWSATQTAPDAPVDVPPLGQRLQLIRAVLVMLLVLSAMLLIQLLLISSRQQSTAQQLSLDGFRAKLAKGTAPIGPVDSQGRQLALGTSVAYLEIPVIGVKQVIAEGTTPSALFNGPGHRRDTPLPGQVGTSVVFGRRAAFGGPFARIGQLTKGDLITVTTGQGVFAFRVLGVRHHGDTVPAPPAKGAGRLVLVTAAGAPFFPDGVVRVDADLEGHAVVGPARILSAPSLPAEEKLMANDGRTLWALALWLQALIALSLAAVWAWHRWGRAQAWVVFLPPLILVGLLTSGEVARLLPNLM
jgi:sortase A